MADTTYPAHGRSGKVEISTSTQVMYITAWTYEESVDETEKTAMGDTAKSYLIGLPDGSGSADFFYDPDDAGQDAVWSNLQDGTTVTLTLYPTGSTAAESNYKLEGTVVIKSCGYNSSKDDMISGSFTFRGFLTKTELT